MGLANKNEQIGEYIEDGYVGSQKIVDDHTYQQILDTIVVACVDILVLHKGKVLIVKRNQLPHKDWWMFGGRMRTGETLGCAAERIFRNETSVTIPNDRFRYMTTFVAAWNLRAHEPLGNGTHTVSLVMQVTVSTDEMESIKLNKEYISKKLVESSDLINDRSYHPALKQCAYALR